MIPIDLTGETAVVTGASQGLGAVTARMLHEAGANVVINYFDDGGGANRARAEQIATELGSRATAFGADVRDAAAIEAMVEQAVEQYGSLQIVVNNAGIVRDRTLRKMTSEEWRDVIDTNLTGVFNVCRAASERLADGGRIVNVSSLSAAIGTFGQANYVAAKAGIMGMTKTLARELAKRGIRANAIAPGLVLTEMGRSIPEPIREQWLANIPLGRFAEPEEIARATLFLCSSLSSYITGQTIHINGGWYA